MFPQSLTRRVRILVHLSLISGFCAILVVGRLRFIAFDIDQIQSVEDFKHYKGTTTTFLFMLWNLMLAWIPYIISLALPRLWKFSNGKWLVSGAMLAIWLLFFPNAPYLITDLLHLKQRLGVPMWYDVMLFFGFAFTGLMLCFASLYEVQHFLQARIGPLLTWISVMSSIILCSFGVYLGRFERLNSWDILHPINLLSNIFSSMTAPGWTLLGVTVLMSGFLTIGYLQFLAFATETKPQPIEID